MTRQIDTRAIRATRRDVLKSAGVGAIAAVAPPAALATSSAARAQGAATPGDLITRRLPRSNESVPAIGLGSFMTFDILPGQKRAHIQEVMRRFWQAGGRVFDVSPLYGMSEVNLGDFASALGINDRRHSVP
jgi:hypothetical protein